MNFRNISGVIECPHWPIWHKTFYLQYEVKMSTFFTISVTFNFIEEAVVIKFKAWLIANNMPIILNFVENVSFTKNIYFAFVGNYPSFKFDNYYFFFFSKTLRWSRKTVLSPLTPSKIFSGSRMNRNFWDFVLNLLKNTAFP